MNKGYKLKSELSESQIEADVASYLGYVTPFWARRFELLAVDEQVTGADKLFNRFIPIYMQFKVSEGLVPIKSNFNLIKPEWPLQKIRLYRRDNSLPGNPILYFKLRNLAKNATELQHNLLRQLHNPPHKYAVYIAPLTLSAKDYSDRLNLSLIERMMHWEPYYFKSSRLFAKNTRRLIEILPFLRGHVSIPPQEYINNSDHHFSFSETGNDIAFHEGKTIIGDFRLSSFIKRIYESFYNNDNIGINKQSFLAEVENYYEKNPELKRPNSQLSVDDRIIEYANHLKYVNGIKLMMLGNENSH